MSQAPPNAPSAGDSQLDALISRIQSLSGGENTEENKPRQQPRRAADAIRRPSGDVATASTRVS